eukprot:CAMPEP_0179070864 /NCGR_PEP_ID=MMETSP0796-20121207/31238_1 /TAXON_ID=73915 /ORGANISM="Pyrodinium bahamense, Strain pbaha01" /LENGTH=68 /DNA_ID=CAMNT_0020767965 /DNA_START=1 /DNA_END=203 /DNA_ORIENTATION=+
MLLLRGWHTCACCLKAEERECVDFFCTGLGSWTSPGAEVMRWMSCTARQFHRREADSSSVKKPPTGGG